MNSPVRIAIVMSALFILLCAVPIFAATPHLFSIQGKALNRTTGVLIPVGNVTIRVYDAVDGGTLAHNETFLNVIVNGTFSVQVGNSTALNLTYNRLYWMEIDINGEEVVGNATSGRRSFLSTGGPDASIILANDTTGFVGVNNTGPQAVLHVSAGGQVNALTVSGANGNIGIGALSPSQRLAILGATNANIVNVSDGTRSFGVYLGNLAGGGTGVTLGSITDHAVRLYSNNTDRLTITSGGFVGIGFMNPSATLHVNGSLNVSGSVIAFNSVCGAGQVLSTTSTGVLTCVTDQTNVGVTIPADNVTAGTFGLGNFVFLRNVSINNSFQLNQYASCTLKTNATGSVVCGGDNDTIGIGIVIPADNVTAGTFGLGNFVFLRNVSVNNTLQFGQYQSCTLKTNSTGGVVCGGDNDTIGIGINIPADNVSAGTFGLGNFVFLRNLSINNSIQLGQYASCTLKTNATGAVVCGGDNDTVAIGITIPADNVSAGTFGLGNFNFLRNLTINNTIQLNQYTGCTLKTNSTGAVVCGGDNDSGVQGILVPAGNVTAGTFAAGTFTFQNNLAVSQNLTIDTSTLFVDSQSDRVGVNTTAPAALVHVQGGNVFFNGSAGAGGAPVAGAGSRFMWIPGKSALRAGNSTDGVSWTDEFIGFNSVAGGVDTYASNNSAAFGDGTQAIGVSSFATGFDTIANGTHATAMGESARAGAAGSFAVGISNDGITSSTGVGSIAFGSGTVSSGLVSFAAGKLALASGAASAAIGQSVTALGAQATAFGLSTTALGNRSLVAGSYLQALANDSIIFGSGNRDGDRLNNSISRSFMVGFNNTPTLFVNGSSVGIGTIAPANTLTVIGDINATGNLYGTFNGASTNTNACTGDAACETNDISAGAGKILINSTTGTVAINTTAPAALLHVQGGTVLFNGTTGSTPVSGTGTRFMWIPAKGALRAGQVTGTQWDDASISAYSVALGSNTVANGTVATALGNRSVASGPDSFAAGLQSEARGNASVALGQLNIASGAFSLAAGRGSSASGDYSVAIGNSPTATGHQSVALGRFPTAEGFSSFAVGDAAIASGINSVAIGYQVDATGIAAVSLGYDSTASGTRSLALGDTATASGLDAVAIGYVTNAAGNFSFAAGANVAALANGSMILGVVNASQTPLLNTIPNSFMVGFNNASATLFVNGSAVGIGTTTPSRTLTVVGDINATGNLFGTFAGTIPYQNSAAGWTNTTTQVYLSNNGTNVSIGSPPALFVDTTTSRIGVGFVAPVAPAASVSVNGSGVFLGQSVYDEGFDGAFPPPGWAVFGDSTGWHKNTSEFLGGSASAGANNSADYETVTLETNFTYNQSGFVSFFWKVALPLSGGGQFSEFYFQIDGIQAAFIDGRTRPEGNWSRVVVPVSAGRHRFTWEYYQDAQSLPTRAYVDNVSFIQGGMVEGGLMDQNLRLMGNRTVGVYLNSSQIVFASENFGISIGKDAFSNSSNSLALGPQASVVGPLSVALGYASIAGGVESFAIGSSSFTNGTRSFAIGYNSQAHDTGSIALGNSAQARAGSLALGGSAFANSSSVAIAAGGFQSVAGGLASLAIGLRSQASGTRASAIGTDSFATGDRAFVLGHNLNATGLHGFIIGSGVNETTGLLTNQIDKSLIVGFNSTTPTLFVNGSSVGIGTTTPSRTLTVVGDINATGNLYGTFGGTAANANACSGDGTCETNDISAGSGKIVINATTGTIAINTTAPAALVHVQGGAVLFNGTGGGTPTSGAGTRLMWIPEKAAFRAGYVGAILGESTGGGRWDDGNISFASFAFGNRTMANASYAFAFGRGSLAAADFAVAGITGTASGAQALAIGAGVTASGTNSVAFGLNSVASGPRSVALGDTNSASAYSSTAIGSNGVASGSYALAAGGEGASATGNYSFVLGSYSNADGNFSGTLGTNLRALGHNSLVIGIGDRPSNLLNNTIPQSLVIGFNTTPVVFVNGSTVGIGTTTPSRTLTVVGDINATGNLYGTFSGTVPASSVTTGTFGAGNFAFPNNVSVGQNFTVSNNVLVVDNATGRVGVRTGSPLSPLDVRLTSTNSASATEIASRILVEDTGATSGNDVVYGQLIDVTRMGASSENVTAYGQYVNVTGDTGGTSTLYGTYYNFVGTNHADVNYGAFSALELGSGNPGDLGYGFYANVKPGISDTGYGLFSNVTPAAGSTGYGLYVEMAGIGTRYAGAFMNGNVGIGTNIPAYPLTVNSSAAGGALLVQNATDHNIFFVNGNTGTVGIRTVVPIEALHVAGNIFVNSTGTGTTSTSYNSSDLILAGSGYNSTATLWRNVSLRNIVQDNNSRLGIFVNGSERLSVDSLGKVGIGTTTPSHLLTVAGILNVSDSIVTSHNVSIGLDARAAGGNSVAIGTTAISRQGDAVAIGELSYTDSGGGDLGVAVGYKANVTGDRGVALGPDAQAGGTGFEGSAIALGNTARAKKSGTIAIGSSTNANDLDAVAIGTKTIANTGSVAVGGYADANAILSTAVGGEANASGSRSIALGYLARAWGLNSMALGPYTNVSGENSTVIGMGNSTHRLNNAAANSLVIGKSSPAVLVNFAANNLLTVFGDINATGNLYGTFGGTAVNANACSGDATCETNDISAGSGKFVVNSTTGRIAINTTAPAALVHVQGGTVLFNGTGGETPISGGGTRFMWIPSKTALRVGAVAGNHWDDVNISNASMAFGVDNLVTGSNSFAFGSRALATGNYSFVFANGPYSLGANAAAHANLSIAIGARALASGVESMALMRGVASGQGSFAVGDGAAASGDDSMAFGHFTTASGDNSQAFGDSTAASNYTAVAFGSGTIASGQGSAAFGDSTNAIGDYSVAFGDSSGTNGYAAAAFGQQSFANGYGAFAAGTSSASGDYAVSFGFNTVAAGNYSLAVGRYVQALGNNAFMLGNGDSLNNKLNNTIPNSFAIGFNTTRGVMLFVNGTNVGIGTVAPNNTLTVIGDINATGNVFGTFAGTLPYQNSAAGWTNTTTNVTTSLAVVVNNSSPLGSVVVVNTTGSAILFINGSSGYVGIGNSSPQRTIHVSNGGILQDYGQNGTLLKLANISGRPYSATVSGKYLFVGTNIGAGTCLNTTLTGCGFRIYDVTNPASPAPAGGFDNVTGLPVQAIQIQGTTAYAALGDPGSYSGNQLNILDFSDPANIRLLNRTILPGSGGITSMVLQGQYLFIGLEEDGGMGTGNEFVILDVAKPTSPRVVGGLEYGVSVDSIAIAENIVYLGVNTSVRIIDVSNPAAPVQIGNFSGGPNEMKVLGKYLFGIYGTQGGLAGTCSGTVLAGCEFRIYDISTPRMPVNVTGLDFGTVVFSLDVFGNYAYIGTVRGTGFAIGPLLSVINLRNVSAPTIVASSNYWNNASSSTVGVITGTGNHLYVGFNQDTLLQVYEIPGIESPGGRFDMVRAGRLDVLGSATIADTLSARQSLLGSGGVLSQGPIISSGGNSIFGGSISVGTASTPLAQVHINATNSTGGSGGVLQPALLIQNVTGSTLLFINGSNGRVGVGTGAPNNALTVIGDINATGNVFGTFQGTSSNANACSGDATCETNDISAGSGKIVVNATTGTVAINTTAPAALVHVQGGAVLFNGTTGGTPTSGGGTRFMWIPEKAALRAGNVSGLQWNDGNISSNSVAFGWNTVANGTFSFAAGDGSMASGKSSVAVGENILVYNNYGTAFGRSNTILNNGFNGFVVGYSNSVNASYGVAGGAFSISSGEAAVALGNTVIARNHYAVAMGIETIASGYAAVALGSENWATGDYSVAFGDTTRSGGYGSVTFGSSTTANGDYSVAMGDRTFAIGNWSLAMGQHVRAIPDYSFVIGSGVNSTTTLNNTVGSSFMVGFNSTTPTLFVNGSSVGIGTTIPARTMHINDTLRIQPRSAAPSGGGLGDLYVDSDTNELCFYNGTAWRGIGNGGLACA